MKRQLCLLLAALFLAGFVFDGIASAQAPVVVKQGDLKIIEKRSLKVLFYETMGGFFGPLVAVYDVLDSKHGINCCNCTEEWQRDYVLLPIILFPLSIPYGVYAIGRDNNQGGSFWASLFGSLVFVGAWAGATSQSTTMSNAMVGVGYYLADVFGGVIGYNLFKPAATKVKIINASAPSLRACLPRVYITPEKNGTVALRVNLFESRF